MSELDFIWLVQKETTRVHLEAAGALGPLERPLEAACGIAEWVEAHHQR